MRSDIPPSPPSKKAQDQVANMDQTAIKPGAPPISTQSSAITTGYPERLKPSATPASKAAFWTGTVMSGLAGAFLLFGAILSLAKPEHVVKSMADFGYSESVIVPIGAALLVGTVLYLIPQTAVLGAILLTGYLGGAVATHVHHQDAPFQIVFPVIFGALLWVGLYLRDMRLRSMVPWRT